MTQILKISGIVVRRIFDHDSWWVLYFVVTEFDTFGYLVATVKLAGISSCI